MLTKTKMALAAALVFGTASAALATAGENAEGGFDTLANGQSVETPAVQNNGPNAYGYVDVKPTASTHHARRHQTIDR
jgi:hypothetical protein